MLYIPTIEKYRKTISDTKGLSSKLTNFLRVSRFGDIKACNGKKMTKIKEKNTLSKDNIYII